MPEQGTQEFRYPEKLGDMEIPERFRGKTAAEAMKMYTEGEKAFGQRSDYDQLKSRVAELEPLSQRVSSYEQALQAWEQYRPHLEKLGWDVKKLQQLSQPQPSTNGLPALDQWVQRVTEMEPQQQWVSFLNEVLVPSYRADQQRYTEQLTGALRQALEQQQNWYSQKEKLLFSMLKAHDQLEDIDLDELYKQAQAKAEEMSKSGIDPFQLVAQTELEKRKALAETKKAIEQARADAVREYQQKQSPRLVGSTRPVPNAPPKGKKAIREFALKNLTEKLPPL